MSYFKKIENSNDSANSKQGAIQKIKEEIRNWYGSLSIRELICNRELVAEIEKLERLMAGQVVVR
ncbi:MAG: hypothetical protein AB7O96_03560 [Pseudobdellovibrionaceae bacterium]